MAAVPDGAKILGVSGYLSLVCVGWLLVVGSVPARCLCLLVVGWGLGVFGWCLPGGLLGVGGWCLGVVGVGLVDAWQKRCFCAGCGRGFCVWGVVARNSGAAP